MTMLALLGVATALAAPRPMTRAELQALATAMAPSIEALAGRRFADPPPVAFATREEIRRVLLGNKDADLPEVHRTLDEDDVQKLWSIDGLYDIRTGTVLLAHEKLAASAEELELTDAEAESRLRCVLAHELTHALVYDHVRPPRKLTTDQLAGFAALNEGHASWVHGRWCAQHESARMAALTTPHRQTVSSLTAEDPGFAYGRGALLVDALYAEDPELFWRLMDDPPAYELIEQAVRDALWPGWADHDPLDRALRSLGTKTRVVTPLSPVVYLSRRLGVEMTATPTVGGAGLYAVGGYRRYSSAGAAFVLADAELAREVIDNRVEQFEWYASHKPGLAFEKVGAPKRIKQREATLLADGAGRLLSMKTEHGLLYQELWAARDQRLFVLATHGIKKATPKVLQEAMNQLMAEQGRAALPGRTDLEPVERWLSRGDRRQAMP